LQFVATINRSAGGTLFEHFVIDGMQTNAGWVLYISSDGDTSGVTLSITAAGQVQYVSSNQANYTSSVFRYTVNQLNI